LVLVSKNIQQRGETISHFFRVVNTFRTLLPKKGEVFSDHKNKANKNNGLDFEKFLTFFE